MPKCFIPRRESAKADIPYGVHLSILYFISRFHEGNEKSRYPPLKLKCQNVLLCGWMDGWMDGWMGGDLLPPYNFFIFKYNNKHHALIPKMCSKVASAFQIKSYEHFKFQNSEFYERFPPRKRIGIFLSKKASPPLRNLVIFRKKCHKKTMISTAKT